MSPSLRDRLLGRNTPPSTETIPAVVTDNGNGDGAVSSSDPLAGLTVAAAAKSYTARSESTVDRLKRELHTKLVERLDLAALEKIRE